MPADAKSESVPRDPEPGSAAGLREHSTGRTGVESGLTNRAAVAGIGTQVRGDGAQPDPMVLIEFVQMHTGWELRDDQRAEQESTSWGRHTALGCAR